jgi:predicted TIM-barrel fold metal-dependent hydrolase
VAIDFHAHLAREDPNAPPFMRSLFDVGGYLERQEHAGIELTVLSYALADLTGTEDELEDARAEHDFLADLIGSYPARFAALAGIDPFGGKPWLDEAERALDGGFAGLCLPTSRQRRYLDAPECADVLALAAERQAVVFLHPSDSPVDLERAGDGVLRAWIGRPYDTGICLARLLLAGTLDEFPRLSMVVAHSGGTLPMLLGRLDHVYDGFERRAAMRAGGGPPGGGPPGGGPPGGGPPGGGPPSPQGEPIPPEALVSPKLDGRRPSQRLGQLYLDTASYHPAALAAAVTAVGSDHVVLGTDFPPAGDSPRPTLDLVEAMGLPPEELELVRSGTARRLLRTLPERIAPDTSIRKEATT